MIAIISGGTMIGTVKTAMSTEETEDLIRTNAMADMVPTTVEVIPTQAVIIMLLVNAVPRPGRVNSTATHFREKPECRSRRATLRISAGLPEVGCSGSG